METISNRPAIDFYCFLQAIKEMYLEKPLPLSKEDEFGLKQVEEELLKFYKPINK